MKNQMETPNPRSIGPACLDDDFEIYNLDSEYSIEIEKGPHFLIEFPVETRLPAAAFEHPNVARKVARILSYKYDNPKRWVEKAGTCFYFAVPRRYITLYPVKGYSWPHGEINGAKVRFNCSGGTGGNGWRDWLRIRTSVNTNYGVRTLRKVAEVAVRGTPFEPIYTREELEEQFYQEHAKDWLVNTAWGSWRVGVPLGMVGVCACIGGHRKLPGAEERYFLVPDAEYSQRKEQFVVDPARHREVPKFPDDRYEKTSAEMETEKPLLSVAA